MPKKLDITAKITGIRYKPFLCRTLHIHDWTEIAHAFEKDGSFILKLEQEKTLALSWWVSAKRTRSYPYARVYDTLSFVGKKVTVIPIFKDEGKEGDRDFLQWDTISLMSLLGIYTIITFYSQAEQSTRYGQKITKQRFDLNHVRSELQNLMSYQSDALHWNLDQVAKVGGIGQKALEAYSRISQELGVAMHSFSGATKRVAELQKDKDSFMKFSRSLAKSAQGREKMTIQPKENLAGAKATLTIENYLGGFYFFTSDEAEIRKGTVRLIEGKHTKSSHLPSLEEIKDGLVKMVLFSNLEQVMINGKEYKPISMLKLTSNGFSPKTLGKSDGPLLLKLRQEAAENGFEILINGRPLSAILI